MKNVLIGLNAALLAFLVFSYVFEFTVYDNTFFYDQYARNKIYDTIQKEEVHKATEELLRYLHDEKEEKLITTPFFNEKEKQHLLDVKRLLQKERVFCTWTSLFFVTTIILFWFYAASPWKDYGEVLMLGGVLGLGLLVLAASLIAIDFDAAFTLFHKLLFTNNLWLLNPATDRLIALTPESFYIAISFRLFFRMIIAYALLTMAGIMAQRR